MIMINVCEICYFYMVCGLGGGVKGFGFVFLCVGGLVGKMCCIGGVDVDLVVICDFECVFGVWGIVLDFFSWEQYIGFYGYELLVDWYEVMLVDLQQVVGNEWFYIVFVSYFCKGNLGLLLEKLSCIGKY